MQAVPKRGTATRTEAGRRCASRAARAPRTEGATATRTEAGRRCTGGAGGSLFSDTAARGAGRRCTGGAGGRAATMTAGGTACRWPRVLPLMCMERHCRAPIYSRRGRRRAGKVRIQAPIPNARCARGAGIRPRGRREKRKGGKAACGRRQARQRLRQMRPPPRTHASAVKTRCGRCSRCYSHVPPPTESNVNGGAHRAADGSEARSRVTSPSSRTAPRPGRHCASCA